MMDNIITLHYANGEIKLEPTEPDLSSDKMQRIQNWVHVVNVKQEEQTEMQQETYGNGNGMEIDQHQQLQLELDQYPLPSPDNLEFLEEFQQSPEDLAAITNIISSVDQFMNSRPFELLDDNSSVSLQRNPLSDDDLDKALSIVFESMTEPHPKKLISRLVCQKWNKVISRQLSTEAYFHIRPDGSNLKVFQNSPQQWTKLDLPDLTVFLSTNLTKQLASVKTLRICPSFPDYLQSIAAKFPKLESLELNILKDVKTKRPTIRENKVGKICSGLKNLLIKCPCGGGLAFLNFLYAIIPLPHPKSQMLLSSLSIHEQSSENHSQPQQNTNTIAISISTYIFTLISSIWKTLKSLEIKYESPAMHSAIFPNMQKRLEDLKKLKLEILNIYTENGMIIIKNEEFLNYRKFVETQRQTLKEITLSKCFNKEQILEILKIVQQTQPNVRIMRKENNFPEANDPSVATIFSFGQVVFQKFLEPGTRHILTELNINVQLHCGRPVFTDSDLQRLIANYKNLKKLKINNCTSITDFGVSGVCAIYCKRIVNSGRLYEPSLEFAGVLKGQPISDLKYLESLELGGLNFITDAAFHYGFGFTNLTSFTFTIFGDVHKVSDWGLHSLAIQNPRLEVLQGAFAWGNSKPLISNDFQNNLQEALPLMESTGKLRIIRVNSRPLSF